MPSDKAINIMVVAGEASGDNHGAKLVRALKELDPGIEFHGLGGTRMKEAGVKLVTSSNDIAVVGITEVLFKLKGILKALKAVKSALKELQPDLVVLIDYPDFNLSVAKAAKEMGIRVLYYISPQVWAWRSGRIGKIRKTVDKMAVILPFEAELYEAAGIKVSFVGHPLLDEIKPVQARAEIFRRLGLADGLTTIAILPGSRRAEVSRHLPVLLKAGELINERSGPVQFVLPLADTIEEEIILDMARPYSVLLKVVKGQTQEAIAGSDLAIVASGTATLETALLTKPMIIIYRLSWFSYLVGRLFIKVRHIGLANIIAGKTVVPELIQRKAAPAAIASEVMAILGDQERRQRMVEELTIIKTRLGEPGAAARTALLAYEMIREGRG